MIFQEFIQSLDKQEPPKVSPMLTALWYDYQGEWDRAHNIVQDINEPMASWIHAYLHRKEGDLGNAGYWYSRAGRNRPDMDFKEEWEQLVQELL